MHALPGGAALGLGLNREAARCWPFPLAFPVIFCTCSRMSLGDAEGQAVTGLGGECGKEVQ